MSPEGWPPHRTGVAAVAAEQGVPACPGLPATSIVLGSLSLMVYIVASVLSSLLPGRCGSP